MLEIAVVVAVAAVLVFVMFTAGWKLYEKSSLAISSNNIRQLTIGAMQYLADHDHHFWPYSSAGYTIMDTDGNTTTGTQWWWGFESTSSQTSGEGNRRFDASKGPLAGYVPASLRPDPSFALHGRVFKPKYRNGYLGIGYNTVLAGGIGTKKKPAKPLTDWELSNPAQVVMFATSAQVYPFASPPVLEEFYMIDQRETTVHFRHGGMAMVGFANGSAGFLPMDESTRDTRLPDVNVGRFAPVGSFQYLK